MYSSGRGQADGSEPLLRQSQAPSTWEGFAESVVGASHKRKGIPGQDAARLELNSSATLHAAFAISDGHGSPKCFRSGRGSLFAVDAGINCAKDFFGANDYGKNNNLKRQFEGDFPASLLKRWRSAVFDDVMRSPITEEELQRLGETTGEFAKDNLRIALGKIPGYGRVNCMVGLDLPAPIELHPSNLTEFSPVYQAYGATILMVIAARSGIYYLQLGDGDILAVSDDCVVEPPITVDDGMIADETMSLCMPDAIRQFRVAFHHSGKQLPAMIMASTDGYSNSFASVADFHKVGADILAMAVKRQGLPDGVTVRAWLDAASEQGSGDDVSLGVLCRRDLINAEAAGPDTVEPHATSRG